MIVLLIFSAIFVLTGINALVLSCLLIAGQADHQMDEFQLTSEFEPDEQR